MFGVKCAVTCVVLFMSESCLSLNDKSVSKRMEILEKGLSTTRQEMQDSLNLILARLEGIDDSLEARCNFDTDDDDEEVSLRTFLTSDTSHHEQLTRPKRASSKKKNKKPKKSKSQVMQEIHDVVSQLSLENRMMNQNMMDGQHRLTTLLTEKNNAMTNRLTEQNNAILEKATEIKHLLEYQSEVMSEVKVGICHLNELKNVGICLPKPKSCSDIRSNVSGVYTVYPPFQESGVEVYCDLETGGGGWTVFQRRFDGSVDFFRGWHEYKAGFGDLKGEFWLGNKYIHGFTSSGQYELRIDAVDLDDDEGFATYDEFSLDTEVAEYAFHYGKKVDGDIDDFMFYHNGQSFATKDKDTKRSKGCAETLYGAWWFKDCTRANLNGLFYTDDRGYSPYHKMNILTWKPGTTVVKSSKMMFRPTV